MKDKAFLKRLKDHEGEREKQQVLRYFKGNDGETKALGIKFGTVFKLAKEFIDMPLEAIDRLLDSKFYEVRMGAVSIMDSRARSKKTSQATKKQLFDLYLRRHDRLNNWDFADRAAPYVVGGYLFDKSRDVLFELAKSENIWERRTAIVSTYYFIRQNDLEDTFKIAEILINDSEELINKAVGSWIREAGKRDTEKLKLFLDKHAATMPRVTLRYALEKFDKKTKAHYMEMKKKS